MESATWWRTPAVASAAPRLRPDVSKNSSTALSSNEGELARSITTCAPARASFSPSPVMLLMPLLGEAAMTSWPRSRRMATVFEPISPVPPMTTIFMAYPPLPTTGDLQMGPNAGEENICAQRVHDANPQADKHQRIAGFGRLGRPEELLGIIQQGACLEKSIVGRCSCPCQWQP